jgi:hypothetical protein
MFKRKLFPQDSFYNFPKPNEVIIKSSVDNHKISFKIFYPVINLILSQIFITKGIG